MNDLPHAAEDHPPMTRVFWGTKLALVFVVLVVGVTKVLGPSDVNDIFAGIDRGDTIRKTTGLLEITGGTLLLTPKFSRLGAALIGAIMSAFVGAHLVSDGTGPIPATILLGLVASIVILERPR